MPTPQVYYCLNEEHEYLKAVVFKMMMSGEVPSIDGRFASVVFDLVSDQTDEHADNILARHDRYVAEESEVEVFDPTDPTSRLYENEIAE